MPIVLENNEPIIRVPPPPPPVVKPNWETLCSYYKLNYVWKVAFLKRDPGIYIFKKPLDYMCG